MIKFQQTFLKLRKISTLSLLTAEISEFSKVKSSTNIKANTSSQQKPNSKSIQKDNVQELTNKSDKAIDEYLKQLQEKDPQKLEQLLLKLTQIQKRDENAFKKNQIEEFIDFHPEHLTQTDVYRALQKIQKTPEILFIEGIQTKGVIDINLFQQKIRNRIHIIPHKQLIQMLKHVSKVEIRLQGSENDPQNQYLWSCFQSEFSKRLETMSTQEIAQTLWLFSYANRSNPEFFRAIQNEIVHRRLSVIDYNFVGKFLWGFSHSNLGSALIYSRIAETINIVQHEIPGMQLAQYSYFFSKASENMKAGFGVYHITERKIKEEINKYSFQELIKVSEYLIQQNIGSNQFLKLVEEQIVDIFPKNNISPGHLVRLIKSTKKHYFLYNDKALFHKLEGQVIKILPGFSPEQLSEVLWSYSKGKRGNNQLYQLLQEQTILKRKLFSSRQLAFSYFSFSSSGKGSSKLYELLEDQVLERQLSAFNIHYVVKMMNGIIIRNSFNSRLFAPVIDLLMSTYSELQFNQLIKLIVALIEAPPAYVAEKQATDEKDSEHETQLNWKKQFDSIFQNSMERIEQGIQLLRTDQVCQVFYAYTTANIGNRQFLFKKLKGRIENPNQVPKSVFAKYLFSLAQNSQFEDCFEFFPIIRELRQYGDIKYFFAHEDFVRLVWAICVTDQCPKKIQDFEEDQYSLHHDFWIEAEQALFQINPNTLQFNAVIYWTQALILANRKAELEKKKKASQQSSFRDKIKSTKEKQQETGQDGSEDSGDTLPLMKVIQKVSQISKTYSEEIIKRDQIIYSDKTIKTEVHQKFCQFFDSQQIQDTLKELKCKVQIIKDLGDEFLNIYDSVCVIQNSLDEAIESKIGIILLNSEHYVFKGAEGSTQDLILTEVQAKLTISQSLLGWNIILINENQWKDLTQEEQNKFFLTQITLGQ